MRFFSASTKKNVETGVGPILRRRHAEKETEERPDGLESEELQENDEQRRGFDEGAD